MFGRKYGFMGVDWAHFQGRRLDLDREYDKWHRIMISGSFKERRGEKTDRCLCRTRNHQ